MPACFSYFLCPYVGIFAFCVTIVSFLCISFHYKIFLYGWNVCVSCRAALSLNQSEPRSTTSEKFLQL